MIITAVVCVSCATIMDGSSQTVGVSSTPTGATVTIDGAPGGDTPYFAKMSRKKSHTVKIEMVGYLPYETTITRHTSGWVWGNIVFGGIPGLVIDAISGGLYKLEPTQVESQLAKNATGAVDTKDGIYIAVTLNPDPSWEKIGSLRSIANGL